MIKLIACIDQEYGLGYKGELLFKIKEDLQRFKQLTSNSIVIMGRKTHQSIIELNGKPLPNRKNIVLTNNKKYSVSHGEFVYHDFQTLLQQAHTYASNSQDIWVIGGQKVYELFLPYADEIHLTYIESVKKSDAKFPQFISDFTPVSIEAHETNDLKYYFLTYKRS